MISIKAMILSKKIVTQVDRVRKISVPDQPKIFPRIPVVVIVSLMGRVFNGIVGLPVGPSVVEKKDHEVVLGELIPELQNLHLRTDIMPCKLTSQLLSKVHSAMN